MTFIEIPARFAENAGQPATAVINPELVVAAYPSKNQSGCILIELNARDENGAVRSVLTPLEFDTVLRTFGPFVHVEQRYIHGGTPANYRVRIAAIVMVRSLPAGGGRVWLVNGEDLLVTDEAMRNLAPLAKALAPA